MSELGFAGFMGLKGWDRRFRMLLYPGENLLSLFAGYRPKF